MNKYLQCHIHHKNMQQEKRSNNDYVPKAKNVNLYKT